MDGACGWTVWFNGCCLCPDFLRVAIYHFLLSHYVVADTVTSCCLDSWWPAGTQPSACFLLKIPRDRNADFGIFAHWFHVTCIVLVDRYPGPTSTMVVAIGTGVSMLVHDPYQRVHVHAIFYRLGNSNARSGRRRSTSLRCPVVDSGRIGCVF